MTNASTAGARPSARQQRRITWKAGALLAWLVLAGWVGIAGLSAAYRTPSLLRIAEFSAIYERAGFSDEFMMTALLVVPLAGSILVAAFIAFRRPADRAALLMAGGLVALYLFGSGAPIAAEPGWLRLIGGSAAIMLTSVFLATFPTGSFIPRWSVIAPAIAAGMSIARPDTAADIRQLLTDPDAFAASERVFLSGAVGIVVGVAAAAQVVRYRRYSDTTERLQSRWVLAGAFGILLPPAVLLSAEAMGGFGAVTAGSLVAVSAVGSYLLPVAVAIAGFRHGLYAIDRIISRTVTYASVAVIVSLVYALPVVVLPSLLGTGNDVIVAGATLGAAAAFNPVRRRIRTIVERRFNRARYDAERELVRMSDRLRAQTSVVGVSEVVAVTIANTLEPHGSAIWIRDHPVSAHRSSRSRNTSVAQ